MTKKELIEQLNYKKIVCLSCVDISYRFSSKDWVQMFNQYVGPGALTINDYTFERNPKELVEKYKNPAMIQDSSLNIIRLGMKDMLSMSFEMIKNYCNETEQFEILKKFPWYNFSRLIRNSFSHNFKFDFTLRYGKKETWKKLPNQKLQFSDRLIELKQELDGKEIDSVIFPFHYSFELYEMMKISVVDDLK